MTLVENEQTTESTEQAEQFDISYYTGSPKHKDDLKECRRIFNGSSSTYSFAVNLLEKSSVPEWRQMATDISTFYALVRVADEIVDGDGEDRLSPDDAKVQINRLKSLLENPQEAFKSTGENKPDDPERIFHTVIRANAVLFKRQNIDHRMLDAFFDSMIVDATGKSSYTAEELNQYIHGSAGVIGWIMANIFAGDSKLVTDADKEIIKTSSHRLGEAMQVTNILRDIFKDFRNLNRIYISTETLALFRITRSDIETYSRMLTVDDRFVDMMRYEIQCARIMYQQSEQGVPYLSPVGQFMTRLGHKLYEAYLDIIERYLNEIQDSGYTQKAPYQVSMNVNKKLLELLKLLVGL